LAQAAICGSSPGFRATLVVWTGFKASYPSRKLLVNMSSSAKRRNDSPAAKASAKAGARVLPTAALTPKPAEPKEPEVKLICGFHPEVFRAVILGPLIVAALIAAAVSFDVGKKVVIFVDAHWNIYSAPVGKFLVSNADAIVLFVSLGALAPFAIVVIVNVWGAAMDLGNFPLWQQGSLLLLVSAAMVGTFLTQQKACLQVVATVQKHWNTISDPIEDILKNKTDAIIAGVAVCCMAPVAAALVSYVLRAIWNCRVKIVVEKTEEKK